MKFIEKYAAGITAAILGIVAITFSALFFVTKNDLNALESATAFLYGNKEVRIIAFTGTDDPLTVDTDERVKILDEIYRTNKNEKSLEDLMSNKTNHFKLGAKTDYGKPINSVGNENTNTGQDSNFAAGEGGKVSSPTYYSDANKTQYDPANFENGTIGFGENGTTGSAVQDKTKPYYGTETLVGAMGLHLITDRQIFVLELQA